MNPGGDAAEQVLRLSLEGVEVAAKISGNGAKNIALLLYATLKQEQRQMFVCRYWYFDPIEEIAARFNCSDSKVKMSLMRTREKLKAHLIKEGVINEDR